MLGMFRSMHVMTLGQVCMVGGFLMVAGFMMFGRLVVVACSVLMVFRCLFVVIGCYF